MRADDCPAPVAPAAARPREREAAVHVLADYTLGDALLTVLWIFGFVIFFWLLIAVFSDIFRSDDLSGWSKALWTIFVIFLPFLGIFVYLIARGSKMRDHAMGDARQRDEQFRTYVQDVTAAPSPAGEVAHLAALRDQGVLSEDEFAKAKAKALSA